MRALIVCITLLFAFLTCTMAQIPSVKVENTKGAQVNTSSLVNHKTPMIISFWATTCKPCIRELDAINEQLPDWLEEASRSTAKARALAEGHGWDDFIMLYDKNQEFMRAMNVSLTPQVYVVDADGKIVYSHTGYAPGSELELLKAIKKLQK